MRRGLQSPSKLARLQALRLAIACSFHSHYVFSKFFHLLETSLYLEDFGIREHLLSSLLDMIYMHHDKILFNDVSHIIIPFLYAPTVNLQLAAIIGCGKSENFELMKGFMAKPDRLVLKASKIFYLFSNYRIWRCLLSPSVFNLMQEDCFSLIAFLMRQNVFLVL